MAGGWRGGSRPRVSGSRGGRGGFWRGRGRGVRQHPPAVPRATASRRFFPWRRWGGEGGRREGGLRGGIEGFLVWCDAVWSGVLQRGCNMPDAAKQEPAVGLIFSPFDPSPPPIYTETIKMQTKEAFLPPPFFYYCEHFVYVRTVFSSMLQVQCYKEAFARPTRDAPSHTPGKTETGLLLISISGVPLEPCWFRRNQHRWPCVLSLRMFGTSRGRVRITCVRVLSCDAAAASGMDGSF